jgi:alanine racemase
MGVPDECAPDFMQHVAAEPLLELEGVFTHFSCADEADLTPSLEQLRRFTDVLERARERSITPRSIHVANSAALLAGKDLLEALPSVTAVRPGLMLYGVSPAPQQPAQLRPVMCLRSRVVRVQELTSGETVGYGRTFSAPADRPGGRTRIATLPLGYADGIACSGAHRAQVWISGRRCPIAGRVSMDYTGIDVGNAEIAVGDEAVIFGNAQTEEWGVSVEEAAEWAGTIPYELLVRVGSRVPRRVVD